MKLKKLTIGTCLIFLLASCKAQPLKSQFTKAIALGEKTKIDLPNVSKPYFAYYLSKDVGRFYSDTTSSILTVGGTTIYLNVNVKAIEKGSLSLDDSLFDARLKQYTYQGTYYDTNNNEVSYGVALYGTKQQSILYMVGGSLEALVYGNQATCARAIAYILPILRSQIIYKERILHDFFYQDTLVYHRDVLDLFADNAPQNGLIYEILLQQEENNENSSQDSLSTRQK